MKSAYLKIIIFVFITNSLVAAANRLPVLADSLYNSGFYNEAITEYYRYLFFHPDCDSSFEIYSKIGYCYINLDEPGKAFAAMDRSISLANTDSLKTGYWIDKAVLSLSTGDIYTAELILKQIYFSQPQDNLRDRAAMLLFLTTVYNHNWRGALNLYKELAAKKLMNSVEIDSILAEASNAKYKSPIVSALLSIPVPGAGQAYSGRWLAGLNAIALNGGLGYLMINNFMKERYATGIALFFFLFQRYYTGNIYQAYNMTIENNLAIDKRFERDILVELGKIYRTMSFD